MTTNADGSSSTVDTNGVTIETCTAPDFSDSSVACTETATGIVTTTMPDESYTIEDSQGALVTSC